MSRRYATQTTVRAAKSREEIDSILRNWGCHQIQWTDDFREGRVLLRFIWEHDGVEYRARFPLAVPTEEEITKEAMNKRTYDFSQNKYDDLMHRRGWSEHRQLLLWLKATFNAVEAGIIEPACVFLPFLEDRDGVTVSEHALPRLRLILKSGGASNLLPEIADA